MLVGGMIGFLSYLCVIKISCKFVKKTNMGEVRAKIVVQNLRDIHLYEEGYLKQSDIRFLELDALADTGAVETLLPQDAAEALGLKTTDRIIVTLANDEKIELP